MAGDWIKMRTDLMTSPKVVRLSSALKADRFRIVGGLHSAWCLFDAHSEDGYLVGYRPEVLDDLIGWPGFSEALISVQWLEDDGENLILPRFDTHNGKSAKRRCMDKDRKKEGRLSASDADNVPQNVCPREEKRREEKEEAKEQSPAVADVSVPSIPNCPHEEIVSAYHEALPELRKVREWSDKRRKALKARWVESRERQDLAWWREYFAQVSKSDFLMGRVGQNPFSCDLEWLVNASNLVKVIEGKYENKRANGHSAPTHIPAGGGRPEL